MECDFIQKLSYTPMLFEYLAEFAGRGSVRISFIMLGLKDYSSGGYYFNFRMVEALQNAGHEVDVVHFTTIPVRIRGSRIGGSFHILRQVLRYKPDLIVISKSYMFMIPLRLLLSFRRYPVLYLDHLEWHRCTGLLQSIRKYFVRWFLSSGTRVWVNSHSTATDVVSLGIPREKIRTIPPGFDKFNLTSAHKAARPVKILSVGTVCPRKDQLTLLKACGMLGKREFQVLILGDNITDPGYVEIVQREADSDQLRGKVTFTGHLSQKDLRSIYNQSHIVANLSYWEGYGIAVAEALWAGLPVLAADAGSVPELVTHGENGFLIPPGDVDGCANYLKELIDNDALREKMSKTAHERAMKFFSWQDTGREFVNLAEETAGCKIRRNQSG